MADDYLKLKSFKVLCVRIAINRYMCLHRYTFYRFVKKMCYVHEVISVKYEIIFRKRMHKMLSELRYTAITSI